MRETYEVGHETFKFTIGASSALAAAEQVLEFLSDRAIRSLDQIYVQSLRPGIKCRLFDITVSDRFVFLKEGTELKYGRKL